MGEGNDNDLSGEGSEGDDRNPLRSVVKDLEQKLKDANKLIGEKDEQIGEFQSAALTSTMSAVGIPEDGPGKLFRETYSGEPTEEAIKTAALEYGLIEDKEAEEADAAAEAAGSIDDAQGSGGSDELNIMEQIEQADTPAEVGKIMAKAGLGSS